MQLTDCCCLAPDVIETLTTPIEQEYLPEGTSLFTVEQLINWPVVKDTLKEGNFLFCIFSQSTALTEIGKLNGKIDHQFSEHDGFFFARKVL